MLKDELGEFEQILLRRIDEVAENVIAMRSELTQYRRDVHDQFGKVGEIVMDQELRMDDVEKAVGVVPQTFGDRMKRILDFMTRHRK